MFKILQFKTKKKNKNKIGKLDLGIALAEPATVAARGVEHVPLVYHSKSLMELQVRG